MPVKKPIPATTTSGCEHLWSLRCLAECVPTYSSNMIPAKRGFIDLSESESSSLVGIGNVSIVVVEVVERGVPA